MSRQTNQETIFSSAARTATPTAVEKYNGQGRALVLVIDVTAVPGAAPSVVFSLKGVDRLSGKKWTLLESAAIVGVGTTVLRVSPDLAASANLIAKDHVPQLVEFSAAHGNANSVTYSVGAHFTF